jgi:hypothetical protein
MMRFLEREQKNIKDKALRYKIKLLSRDMGGGGQLREQRRGDDGHAVWPSFNGIYSPICYPWQDMGKKVPTH